MSPKSRYWNPGGDPGGNTHRQTELGRFVYRQLSDGEWHDRETLIREVMKKVPPGEAFRKAEDVRHRHRILRARQKLTPAAFAAYMEEETYKVDPPTRPRKSMDAEVLIGKRAIANYVVGARTTSRIETRIHEGRKQVRLRPLHPKYSQSRASQLRAEWVRVNGEVKTDDDMTRLRRYVHRVMEQEGKARRRKKNESTND